MRMEVDSVEFIWNLLETLMRMASVWRNVWEEVWDWKTRIFRGIIRLVVRWQRRELNSQLNLVCPILFVFVYSLTVIQDSTTNNLWISLSWSLISWEASVLVELVDLLKSQELLPGLLRWTNFLQNSIPILRTELQMRMEMERMNCSKSSFKESLRDLEFFHSWFRIQNFGRSISVTWGMFNLY